MGDAAKLTAEPSSPSWKAFIVPGGNAQEVDQTPVQLGCQVQIRAQQSDQFPKQNESKDTQTQWTWDHSTQPEFTLWLHSVTEDPIFLAVMSLYPPHLTTSPIVRLITLWGF